MLRALLREAGINIGDALFVNVVSCMPGVGKGVRKPGKGEVEACTPNRRAQVDIGGDGLLLLGNTALETVRPDLKIGQVRGRFFTDGERVCMATYHPAAILRNKGYLGPVRADLTTWAKWLADSWSLPLGDRCLICASDVAHYDGNGFGYCTVHWKKGERAWQMTKKVTTVKTKLFQ